MGRHFRRGLTSSWKFARSTSSSLAGRIPAWHPVTQISNDRRSGGQPGLVVSCGTAITIERITASGVWQGGVIAPGLFLNARALHMFTAQLPLVRPDRSAPSWGRGTIASLEAGVFWGTVESLRELLARQTFDRGASPWIVWTGGDAERLASVVCGADALIIPDLVLLGLATAGL